MPRIQECRFCGDCCFGCIFLSYDREKNLVGCLIYNNAYRRLVEGQLVQRYFSSHHGMRGKQRGLERFFDQLLTIIRAEGDPESRHKLARDVRMFCDDYECLRMKKGGESKFDIRLDESFKVRILFEAMLQQKYRDLIPNFEILVEVLNS